MTQPLDIADLRATVTDLLPFAQYKVAHAPVDRYIPTTRQLARQFAASPVSEYEFVASISADAAERGDHLLSIRDRAALALKMVVDFERSHQASSATSKLRRAYTKVFSNADDKAQRLHAFADMMSQPSASLIDSLRDSRQRAAAKASRRRPTRGLMPTDITTRARQSRAITRKKDIRIGKNGGVQVRTSTGKWAWLHRNRFYRLQGAARRALLACMIDRNEPIPREWQADADAMAVETQRNTFDQRLRSLDE